LFIYHLSQIGYFPSSYIRLFNSEKKLMTTAGDHHHHPEQQQQKRKIQHHKRLDCWWPNAGRRMLGEKMPTRRHQSHKSLLDLVSGAPQKNGAAFSVGSVAASEHRQHRVFGVDIEDYLAAASGKGKEDDLPTILTECTKSTAQSYIYFPSIYFYIPFYKKLIIHLIIYIYFYIRLLVIEEYGTVTGIYRQCGIQSNVRRIRTLFDSGLTPVWDSSILNNDIHCVSSLLKQYFRLLPNPLFPHHLYGQMCEAYVCEGKSSNK
jgi:hypothetical protein